MKICCAGFKQEKLIKGERFLTVLLEMSRGERLAS